MPRFVVPNLGRMYTSRAGSLTGIYSIATTWRSIPSPDTKFLLKNFMCVPANKGSVYKSHDLEMLQLYCYLHAVN